MLDALCKTSEEGNEIAPTKFLIQVLDYKNRNKTIFRGWAYIYNFLSIYTKYVSLEGGKHALKICVFFLSTLLISSVVCNDVSRLHVARSLFLNSFIIKIIFEPQ